MRRRLMILIAVAAAAFVGSTVWAASTPLVAGPAPGDDVPLPSLPSTTLPPPTLPDRPAPASKADSSLPPVGEPVITRDVDVDICSRAPSGLSAAQRRLHKEGCDAVRLGRLGAPDAPAFPDPAADEGSLRALVASRLDGTPTRWWEDSESIEDALLALRPEDPPSADGAAGRIAAVSSPQHASTYRALLAHELLPRLRKLNPFLAQPVTLTPQPE